MEIVGELICRCVEKYIKAKKHAEYLERYEWQTRRYEKMKKQCEAIEKEFQRWKEQHDSLNAFISTTCKASRYSH